MLRYPVARLEELATELAVHAGVDQDDARILARSLIDADVHGTSTHGLSRLGTYLDRLQRGLIEPRGLLTVERQHGAVLAIDGGNGLGQVQAVKTLDLLKPLARRYGVASATVRRSQHFGALSFYTNLAAQEDMILLAMTNCEPAMAPTGGYEAFFGTNPIAASFPTGDGAPVQVDLATSVVARGKIISARREGRPIPAGWALTKEGLPTTDAAAALDGTVQTMAGHKGYALALLVETFSGVLSGAAVGSGVGSMYKTLDRPQDVGHFFCLFDVSAFMPAQAFHMRMQETIGNLKKSKRQDGVDEILIPGERSNRISEANLAEGIVLSPETRNELREWCRRFGVEPLAESVDTGSDAHSASEPKGTR